MKIKSSLNNVYLKDIIKELREYYGISQKKMGEDCDIYRNTINSAEDGTRFLNEEKFNSLFETYNLTHLLHDLEYKERIIDELRKFKVYDLMECLYFLTKYENEKSLFNRIQQEKNRRYKYYKTKKWKERSKKRYTTRTYKQRPRIYKLDKKRENND